MLMQTQTVLYCFHGRSLLMLDLGDLGPTIAVNLALSGQAEARVHVVHWDWD